jgi:hypothetical protein
MSRFTEILQVAPLPDGRNWVILKDFGYDVGEKDSGETINVPIGFLTDFASVPRPFWWFAPKWGLYGNAAVIHDFCYWDQSYSRKKSDDLFREGMRVLKVGRVKTWLLYYAVRYFGCMAWNANRKRKRKGVRKVLEKLPEKVSDWNAMKVMT